MPYPNKPAKGLSAPERDPASAALRSRGLDAEISDDTSEPREFRQRQTRRRKSRPERATASESARIGDLFVARESDLSDTVLMSAMVGHTLAYGLDLPGVDMVRDLELLPLLDPDQCSAATGLQIRVLTEPGARAVLFQHQGVLYLYSMGSAAKADEDGDNAFINILIGVLKEFRPKRLHVATFSRLVRAPEFSGALYAAVLSYVDIVMVGLLPIDLTTQHGKALWQVFGLVAAMERDLIVARLVAGMVAKYRRGEWVSGKLTVPLGYWLNPATCKIEIHPDPNVVRAVRQLLIDLADPKVTKREAVRRAGQSGLTTARLRQLYGDEATLSDSRNPGEIVRTLLSRLSTYRDGRVVVTQPNSFQGLQHVAGHPLDFEDPEDKFGYLTFTYDWGVPDGGWVDESVLQAVQRRAGASDPTGGAAHARLGPLTGCDWVEDGFRLFLTGTGGKYYHLMSEPFHGSIQDGGPDLRKWQEHLAGDDSDHPVTLDDRAVQSLLAARRVSQ